MRKVEPVPAFRQAQEEQCYNLNLLAHHLAEDQIYDEFTSEEALAAMAAENPNFVAEQRCSCRLQRGHDALRRGSAASGVGD